MEFNAGAAEAKKTAAAGTVARDQLEQAERQRVVQGQASLDSAYALYSANTITVREYYYSGEFLVILL
jgi:methyl coenzyme M reductase beta subunit